MVAESGGCWGRTHLVGKALLLAAVATRATLPPPLRSAVADAHTDPRRQALGRALALGIRYPAFLLRRLGGPDAGQLCATVRCASRNRRTHTESSDATTSGPSADD